MKEMSTRYYEFKDQFIDFHDMKSWKMTGPISDMANGPLPYTYSKTCLIRHALGENFLCRNRQDIGLYSVKFIENVKKGIKINVG